MRCLSIGAATAAVALMILAPPLAAQEAAEDAAQTDRAARPTQQMQAVLDKLKGLGAQPISTLSVDEARSQPSPADAVGAVMEARGIQPDPAFRAVATTDVTIPGAAGDIAARIYTPDGEGPFPVIV